jgi:hypothetical protein
MIYGVVNLHREATLPLVVGNAEKHHLPSWGCSVVTS